MTSHDENSNETKVKSRASSFSLCWHHEIDLLSCKEADPHSNYLSEDKKEQLITNQSCVLVEMKSTIEEF